MPTGITFTQFRKSDFGLIYIITMCVLKLVLRKMFLMYLRYDLTDTRGVRVLENKVLGTFHGLDDYSVLDSKWRQEIACR